MEWESERLYDFLVAIIQVKEGWKSLAVEAAILLLENLTFPTIDTHPLHFLCVEVVAGLPESPLSVLQDAYSASMRSKAWILLQACGLSLAERMDKIEKLVQETPNFASAQILDALSDVVIFSRLDSTLQSSASTCLRKVTEPQWQSLHHVFGRWVVKLLRARSSLNDPLPRQFSRLASFDPADTVMEDLFTFCSHAAPVSHKLVDTAALMILRNICNGCHQDRIHCAVAICKLSENEIEEALKLLLINIPSLP
ncbi:hypothetical protein B0H16DRAFT_293005 [Mycena metata]|uniref:Uncharacterized protein n=1 Tax=Mycena metata TaxID=1033252 RepID=A0AAD7P1V3_9AGAR|nr:hypothetical protein B0H16DRAFT_293005 [Mycena metata]